MNRFKNILSEVLPFLAIAILLVGFYGPMVFAAAHTNMPGGQYLLCAAGGTAFSLLLLGIGMTLFFIADRICNPNAFREWFPESVPAIPTLRGKQLWLIKEWEHHDDGLLG